MTVREMLEWFDIIQDKSNSVYFLLEEKLEFLNRAQAKLVNEYYLYQDENIRSAQVLEPLTISDIAVSSSITGTISYSDIVLAMGGEQFLFIKSLAYNDVVPAKDVTYVRDNDFYKLENNIYTRSSLENPVYRISKSQIKVSPIIEGNFLITVIKSPREMIFNETNPLVRVDSELPVFIHEEIVATALDSAGVASRDDVLLGMKEFEDSNVKKINK